MKKIKIASASGFSMVGCWDHSLYCTFCADNTVSLRIEMGGDAPTYRPKGIRHIKTAKQFLDAIESLCGETLLIDSIDWEKVCVEIGKYSLFLADEIKELVFEAENPELPQDVIKKIDSILIESPIYPPSCRNLSDRRIVYEASRLGLQDYYRAHGTLPEKDFTVNGFTFEIITSATR